MSYIASLDLGSDSIKMALGEVSRDSFRLLGVEMAASRGIHRGEIDNKLQFKSVLEKLLNHFEKKYNLHIESLHVALPSLFLKEFENEVSLYTSGYASRSRKIRTDDLIELNKRCEATVVNAEESLIELLPLTYKLDNSVVDNPVGIVAESFSGKYKVRVANTKSLSDLRDFLNGIGFENIQFFSAFGAIKALFDSFENPYSNFALIDMGADSIKIAIYKDKTLVYDSVLPLGSSTIDWDLNTAFSIHDHIKAKRLKHKYGVAMCTMLGKGGKIIIPDTNFCIEEQHLAFVEQCRLEELLEGVILQIRESGFYNKLKDGILLTGGGSRVSGIEELLKRLSGHNVRLLTADFIPEIESDIANMPEYLAALGLLLCGEEREEKTKMSLSDFFGNFFR